jgi:hypothetical protein
MDRRLLMRYRSAASPHTRITNPASIISTSARLRPASEASSMRPGNGGRQRLLLATVPTMSRHVANLRAALAAVLVPDNAPELRLVRDWLNNWSGLGLIVGGMTHQGWEVQLTAYAARDWRANFFPVGIAHSIVGGSAWKPTP